MDNLIILLGVMMILLFLSRRFVRKRETFPEYCQRHQKQTQETYAAMQEANRQLSFDEAMGAVVLGVKELLGQYPQAEQAVMRVDGERLCVVLPTQTLEVRWLSRRLPLQASTWQVGEAKRGTVYQGCWRVRVSEGASCGVAVSERPYEDGDGVRHGAEPVSGEGGSGTHEAVFDELSPLMHWVAEIVEAALREKRSA